MTYHPLPTTRTPANGFVPIGSPTAVGGLATDGAPRGQCRFCHRQFTGFGWNLVCDTGAAQGRCHEPVPPEPDPTFVAAEQHPHRFDQLVRGLLDDADDPLDNTILRQACAKMLREWS